MPDLSTLKAGQIPVRAFRQVLYWPVLLRGEPHRESRATSRLETRVCELELHGWKRTDGVAEILAPISGTSYQEIVYFHPFVRDFLFGDGVTKVGDRALRRLSRREQITHVQVQLSREAPVICCDVLRTDLYLCKPDVALLVVEIEKPRYLDNPEAIVSLSTILAFQDAFRRVYPAFWFNAEDPNCYTPGLCPWKVTWHLQTGHQLGSIDPASPGTLACSSPPAHFHEFAMQGAEPPVFTHWQQFFGELPPLSRRLHESGTSLGYQQLLDERMPTLTYVAVDNPQQISEGDYDRLTFLDPPGDDSHPYDSGFLSRSRSRYEYDRFRNVGTRYLCSGYGMTVVGSMKDEFYEKTLLQHFSKMYFCMGLIAHYQHAALLSFADQLADLIKILEGKGPAEELADQNFRKQVEELQMTFLKFRSRGWFPQVTSVLQGSEIFALWFERLGTQSVFDRVDATSQRLHDALAEHETRTLARVQTDLSRLAWLFVIPSLAISFAGVESSKWTSFYIGMVAFAFVVAGIGMCWGCLGAAISRIWQKLSSS